MKQRMRSTRALALVGALAVFGAAFVSASAATPPAYALDLPTWDDVQKAKGNQAAAAKKVTEIEALIVQVKKDVKTTQEASLVAGNAYMQAEDDFILADQRVNQLSAEAEKSKAEAEQNSEQAASLASQMYRTGGMDQNMELLLDEDGSTADVLLEKLAMMSKATERNTTLYEEAKQAQNNATSLEQQAAEARTEREDLRNAKEEAKNVAANAAADASTKLANQEQQEKQLEAQLAALKDETATTVSGYEERLRIEEEERRKAEEAARKAAEEAARKAAEEEAARQAAYQAEQERIAAENAANGGGGTVAPPVTPPVTPPITNPGGGNVGTGGGGGGWVRPSGGGISSHFSTWRPACNNGYCATEHTGTDLAAGYGTPIVAATSGTVELAGWTSWGGGNMVWINHAGGFQTRYAHMSEIYVGAGQSVAAGQVIGLIGATGNANGPHLHFETLIGGVFVDPYYFMGDRGVWF